jgi:glycerophosphoryl diester phosphodiesterase
MQSSPNRPLCIGHRGACGHEPENTLRSIRRALEMGVDGIEIDVQRVEGELVVFHDAKLDRTTNGRGYLKRQTFAYLRSLDAGAGERIPTLREVTEAIARRAFLNIELKGAGTARPVAELIAELMAREGWTPEHFIVSSFLRRELRDFRAVADPRIPVGVLLARPTRLWLRTARLFQASAIHPPVQLTSARFVERAHRHGLKVFAYTVNTPAGMERMRQMGVDGVFTDFPELALKAAGEAVAPDESRP